jgi:CheY-like chemotaxis protein
MTKDPGGPLILVVDDEPDGRDALVYLLNQHGYVTTQASTGADALTLAQQLSPALIIMDLGLPDITGWEVMLALKAGPPMSAIPVIVLSGRVFPNDRERAARAGCAAFVAKPAGLEELMPIVQSIIGAAKRRED